MYPSAQHLPCRCKPRAKHQPCGRDSLRDGRLLPQPPDWGDAAPEADARYAELAGKTAKQAQARIVELLAEHGELVGAPKPITHPVKFYERGDRPLEIVSSRQWYIRNGGRDP